MQFSTENKICYKNKMIVIGAAAAPPPHSILFIAHSTHTQTVTQTSPHTIFFQC